MGTARFGTNYKPITPTSPANAFLMHAGAVLHAWPTACHTQLSKPKRPRRKSLSLDERTAWPSVRTEDKRQHCRHQRDGGTAANNKWRARGEAVMGNGGGRAEGAAAWQDSCGKARKREGIAKREAGRRCNVVRRCHVFWTHRRRRPRAGTRGVSCAEALGSAWSRKKRTAR